MIYLNGTASIDLQTHADNAANIASLISGGKLLINGSTNAVSGVNYTYDAGTGVLQVIPEPATIGLLAVGFITALIVRRRS